MIYTSGLNQVDEGTGFERISKMQYILRTTRVRRKWRAMIEGTRHIKEDQIECRIFCSRITFVRNCKILQNQYINLKIQDML